MESISEDTRAKNFPNPGKETDIQFQEAQGPEQDEFKEVYTEDTL